MTRDIGKDYRDPLLTGDDGTFRISGWNNQGDCDILLESLVNGKSITPADVALSSKQHDDWSWIGFGRPIGVSDPAFADFNSSGIYCWQFANGKELHFPAIQLPHQYATGTDIPMHIHFCSTTAVRITGTWTLDVISWLTAGTGALAQAKQTMSAAFDVNPPTATNMITIPFANGTLLGAGRDISSIALARLSLALTSGGNLALLGLDGHYQKDRLGSRQEWIK
jgi:hypothetical protein